LLIVLKNKHKAKTQGFSNFYCTELTPIKVQSCTESYATRAHQLGSESEKWWEITYSTLGCQDLDQCHIT